MPKRCPIALLVTTVLFLAPVVVSAQTVADWTAPRTSDGRPDLQGVWANNNITPLERPEQWAGKDRLSAEELSELQAATARVTASGNDAQFGDQLVLKALADIEDADSYDTTGNYNQFWMADRDFTNRTSLVVRPADGRIPPLTEQATERQAAARAHARFADPERGHVPAAIEGLEPRQRFLAIGALRGRQGQLKARGQLGPQVRGVRGARRQDHEDQAGEMKTAAHVTFPSDGAAMIGSGVLPCYCH